MKDLQQNKRNELCRWSNTTKRNNNNISTSILLLMTHMHSGDKWKIWWSSKCWDSYLKIQLWDLFYLNVLTPTPTERHKMWLLSHQKGFWDSEIRSKNSDTQTFLSMYHLLSIPYIAAYIRHPCCFSYKLLLTYRNWQPSLLTDPQIGPFPWSMHQREI